MQTLTHVFALDRVRTPTGPILVACDRDEASLAKLEAELARHRVELAVCVADVTNRRDVDAVFALGARTFGGVDLVVSNAGTAPEGRLDSQAGEEALRGSLETNLLSHVIVAGCASSMMRASRRGGSLRWKPIWPARRRRIRASFASGSPTAAIAGC